MAFRALAKWAHELHKAPWPIPEMLWGCGGFGGSGASGFRRILVVGLWPTPGRLLGLAVSLGAGVFIFSTRASSLALPGFIAFAPKCLRGGVAAPVTSASQSALRFHPWKALSSALVTAILNPTGGVGSEFTLKLLARAASHGASTIAISIKDPKV
jgi:hypothetical protein